MAWRSSGSTNDEMITNLKRFGVIKSPPVEEGFRAVDRRFFVPRDQRHLAHSDQPLRSGNVHISAPHMYGTVVEALELKPNSCTSFLNIGSGTGYLSCIVASILGPTSTHYAVDIHADVIEHCKKAMQEWKGSMTETLPEMEIIRGNGLHIASDEGEGFAGLDRIYIGAAVGKRYLNQLVKLLKPGGILIGPVEDELVKVHRVGTSDLRADLAQTQSPTSLSSDYLLQVVSSVRFAPMSESPVIHVILPANVWSPERHALYPQAFRQATKQVLLCSHAAADQPPPTVKNAYQNVACKLPSSIWAEIFSYARRDWFDPPVVEERLLRSRLHEEQEQNQRTQERLEELEARLRATERERNIYRLMAVRWQKRLRSLSMDEEDSSVTEDEVMATVDETAASSALVDGRLRLVVVRRNRFAAGRGNDRDEQSHSSSDDNDEADEDGDDDTDSNGDGDDFSLMSEESQEHEHASAFAIRPQIRSVSISAEDT